MVVVLTRTISRNDSVNELCRDRVQDPVALSRDQVPVLHHCNSCSFKLLAQLVVLVGHIAHIDTILKNIKSSGCQLTNTGALLCKRYSSGRHKEREKEQGKRDLLPPACCRESACVELSHVAHTDDAQLDGLHFDQSFLVLHAEKNKTLIVGAVV